MNFGDEGVSAVDNVVWLFGVVGPGVMTTSLSGASNISSASSCSSISVVASSSVTTGFPSRPSRCSAVGKRSRGLIEARDRGRMFLSERGSSKSERLARRPSSSSSSDSTLNFLKNFLPRLDIISLTFWRSGKT